MNDLNSVVISQKADGSWQALHVPSGKISHGLTKDEAEEAMRADLGLNHDGQFEEPLTSAQYSGMAYEIAEYLEGPVSDMLKLHSGFARLEAYEDSIAHIRLGGGCKGCPSSSITLLNGVQQMLREKFGEEAILDVIPVM